VRPRGISNLEFGLQRRMASLLRALSPTLFVAGLAVGGCGGASDPTGIRSAARAVAPPTTLNTVKIERAIEQSSLAQRGIHARVTCPATVPQTRGDVFSCTAVADHQSTQFIVTELNGSGDVHYEGR
jgi:hypothetical protein